MTNMFNSKGQAVYVLISGLNLTSAQSTLAAQTMAITDVTPLISRTVAEICLLCTQP